MLCKRCSFNNQEGSVFCSGCGANLKEADSVTISKPVSAPVTQPADNGLEMPKNTKHDYSVQPGVNALSEAPKISGEVPPAYTPPVYSAPVTPVYTAPVYGAPVSPYGGYQDQSSRVIGETKRQFGSPLMIAGSAALTFSVFMSVISFFVNFDTWKQFFYSLIAPFLEEVITYDLHKSILESCGWITIGAGIILLGMSISLVIGLWLTVAQRFTYSPKVETMGLSCIKAAHRSFIAIASCALGYVAIIFIKSMIDLSEYGDYPLIDEIRFNTAFFSIIMIAIIVLYIITYVGANGSMSRCEASMKFSGSPFYASTFTAVMLLVFSALSIFALALGVNYGEGLMKLFGDVFYKTYGNVFVMFSYMVKLFSLDVCSVIATLFFVVSSVCFAISIFMQRFTMLRIYYETKRSGI